MNLTAIVEVTESCNLSCNFCLRPSFLSGVMSKKTLEKVISHIMSYSRERVSFLWHGGEPLIAGLNFFKEIPKLQRKYNTKKIIVSNNIQTNSILLNRKFVDFFEKEDFEVGTSIQGTRETHDSSRITGAGEPTYDKVLLNIKRLKKKPSAIIVLTKDVLGRESEIYFSIKPYVRGIRISEYFPRKASRGNNLGNRAMPSPLEWGESMLKFYKVWKNDSKAIDVRPITEIIRSFVIGKSEGCLYSQEACKNSIVGVKTSGDFYTCIRGAGKELFFLGNVNSKPLKNYEKRAEEAKNYRIENLLNKSCKNCEFWEYCNGGCPLESFNIHNDLLHKAYYCRGRKMLFRAILKDIFNKV